MFKHIYFYRLKTLTRDRESLFWTLFFPLILATFFFLGLSSIASADKFEAISIAVVDDHNWQDNEDFQRTLRSLSTGEDALFSLEEVSEEKAVELLRSAKVSSYIKAGMIPELIVTRTNFGASVSLSFLNQYVQMTASVNDLITNNPQEAQAILADMTKRETWIENLPVSSHAIDPLLNYFFSLIAMSCLYGSMMGMREINEIQANQSALAARVNASATVKIKHLLSSSLASLTLHFIQIILLLLFIRFILGIEFGQKSGFIVLTAFIGSLCGLSYGSFISAVVRGSMNIKIAIMITSTMLMSFFSGMMFAPMKQLIKQHAPILAYNPVTLITDAFFSLHYYEDYLLYGKNILFLLAFVFLFTFLTYLMIRRTSYASI